MMATKCYSTFTQLDPVKTNYDPSHTVCQKMKRSGTMSSKQ